MAVQYRLNAIGVEADRDLQAWTLRDRVYRLKVTTDQDSYEVGNVDGAGDFPLHINFKVDRVYGVELNLASIRLWNISETLQTMLLMEGARVELRAGYGDPKSIPLIFEGTVVQMYPELSGADRIYNIECVDGFQELCEAYISLSFAPYTTLYDVFVNIGQALGIQTIISERAEQASKAVTFKNGISLYGRGSDVLKDSRIAKNYTCKVEAGVLYISWVTEKRDATTYAYVLTPNTGLIGMPMKLFESSVTQNEGYDEGIRYAIYGYRVQFFMNGALRIDDPVYLESREVSGPFTIYKMSISGDNLSGDWMCTAELKEWSPQVETVTNSKATTGAASHGGGGGRF